MPGTMVLYTETKQRLCKKPLCLCKCTMLFKLSIFLSRPLYLSLSQAIYADYIRGIRDTKKLINFKWRRQVWNAWLSSTKHSRSSCNTADFVDNQNQGTSVYILSIVSMKNLNFDKSRICMNISLNIDSNSRKVVIHSSVLVFMIF